MSKPLHIAGEELWQAIEQDIPTNRPAAVVFNSHITGLAVMRSLGEKDVPVIALDRDGRAYGLSSKHVTVGALCPNPLTDEQEFIDMLVGIGKRLPQKGVLFPSNDEWVFAISRYRQQLAEYYEFPFSELETIERILNKKRLYKEAERLGIPIPKTWYPEEWSSMEELAEELPYPCIVKPVEQRSFYEAFEVKVFQVEEKQQLFDILERTKEHEVVVQEVIGERLSDFYSLCSYVGKNGEAKGVFIGRKLEQYPASFGTACLVSSEHVDSIAQHGVDILKTLGYQGISESEFIYDEKDGTYKLLDINTRTWKWIGLPIHCGIDLPYLAYAEAIGEAVQAANKQKDHVKWVYFKDYLKLKAEHAAVSADAHLNDEELKKVVQGALPTPELMDAVLDKDDSEPGVRLLKNVYSHGYVCPC